MGRKTVAGMKMNMVERAMRKVGHLVSKGVDRRVALLKASNEFGVDIKLMTYGNS